MDYQNKMNSSSDEGWETKIRASDDEEALMTTELRKGPWTEEEDFKLTSAVSFHGLGRWNTLANLAGLRRSGKSCRLRWLNYLRPDLRRGGFTLDEQLLILELHLRWGNRWSKIAENLPGRTDNEIKNYWRTKVQKLARQFQCHVDSPEFKDALRRVWIPRLVEQIQANASPTSNIVTAQNKGLSSNCGVGPKSSFSSSSTSSSNCSMFDKPPSWAQTSQCIVGPAELLSKPNNITLSCGAHKSLESRSSGEFDPYWEQKLNDLLWNTTLYDGDDTLFLQRLDYLA